jgi:archaellum component FlaF (FlaF/FlaG flagellin family)
VDSITIDDTEVLKYFTVNKSAYNDSVLITLSYNSSIQKPSNVSQFKVPITVNGSQTKTFTISCLDGTIDYDLWVTPDFAKTQKLKNGTHTYTPEYISVEITKTDLSPTSTTIGQKMTRSEFDMSELYLTCNIDGMIKDISTISVSQTTDSEILKLKIPQYNDNQIPQKITISLFNSNDQLIDWSEVAILQDGEKGEKGDRGESAYYLDITNDFD